MMACGSWNCVVYAVPDVPLPADHSQTTRRILNAVALTCGTTHAVHHAMNVEGGVELVVLTHSTSCMCVRASCMWEMVMSGVQP